MKNYLDRIGHRKTLVLFGLGFSVLAGGILLEWALSSAFPLISLCLTALVLLGAIYVSYYRIYSMVERRSKQDYANLEALQFLLAAVQPRLPLAGTRGWVASPDFMNIMVEKVLSRKPGLIVEAGSGMSSLLLGYALEKNGKGTLVSLDHSESYAAQSMKKVEQHGLEPWVEIVYAPLRTYRIGEKDWLWYDLAPWTGTQKIDLLIIDGPPSKVQQNARYPALPLLMDRLSANALILVDDCIRQEDLETVKRWVREFPGWELEVIDTEKKTAVLQQSK